MNFEPKLYRLSNGIPVILDNMDIETATVNVAFDTGARDERPNEYGITHFCEHVFCLGSKRFFTKKERRDFLENHGGIRNAATGLTNITFSGRIIAENLNVLLNVIADMLHNALFDCEQIDLERGVVIDELHRNMDKPGREFYNFIMKNTYNSFVPNGLLVLGNEENIKSFTPKQLKEYISNHLSARNCVIVISGRILDTDAVIKHLDNLFSFLPNKEVVKDTSKVYTPFIGNNKVNSNNVKLNILWPVLYKDTYENRYKNKCISVFDSFFRRELMEILRNQNGLVYGVDNSSCGYPHDEIFGIGTEVSVENIERLMALIAKTAYRIYNENPITQQEIDKMFNVGRLGDADFLESSTYRCDQLSFFYRFYGRVYDFNENIKQKKAVNSEDVIKYTRGYFDGDMSIITQGSDFNCDLKQIWQDNFK